MTKKRLKSLIGKQVKIIASLPNKQQDSIEDLIGKTFEVRQDTREDDGEIGVESEDFGGIIQLQPGEWQLL